MTTNKQSNFDRYISQILTLNIRGSREVSLRHYSQFESNYENDLKELQQLAINELLLHDHKQIKSRILILEEINNRFKEFWKVYKKWFSQFEKDEFDIFDFKEILSNYFNFQKSNATKISIKTFYQLHDAVMFKQGSVLGVIERLKKLVNKKDTKRNNASKKSISLFCQLVNHSNIIKQGERTNEQYCIQVCQHFKLEYTDNVRQHYKLSEPEILMSSKELLIVEQTILPFIDKRSRDKIYQYLGSKKK